MESIKSKIQKVLELAKRGGTEAESDTAMKIALELLAKHNLSMSDIADIEVKDEDVTESSTDVNRQVWQSQIWNGVSNLYFCTCYQKRYSLNGKDYKSIVVIGKPSNIETAKEVVSHLIHLAESLCDSSGQDRSWRNSFKNGFTSRVCARCRETKANHITKLSHENQERGLVIINLYALTAKQNADYLKAKGIRLCSTTSRTSARNGEGYRAGQSAGNSANLSRSGTLKLN